MTQSMNQLMNKLDGVDPVDNRPSTEELHHCVLLFLKDIFTNSAIWAKLV